MNGLDFCLQMEREIVVQVRKRLHEFLDLSQQVMTTDFLSQIESLISCDIRVVFCHKKKTHEYIMISVVSVTCECHKYHDTCVTSVMNIVMLHVHNDQKVVHCSIGE